MTKACTKCHLEKPLIDYYPKKRGREGLTSYCKACHRILNNQRAKTRRKEKPKKEHCVYFVAGGGLIKIGRTCELAKRLMLMQVGSPVRLSVLATIPCETPEEAVAQEANLHDEFAVFHSHGEWFWADPKILEAVKDMQVDILDKAGV